MERKLPLALRAIRKWLRTFGDIAARIEPEYYLRKAGLAHATRIPTWTTRNELGALFNLAMATPTGARALEIGSYLGASTCFLMAGLKIRQGHLTCIDTWQNETMPEGQRDTMAEFRKHLAPVWSDITVVRGRSSQLPDGALSSGVSLAFIDGDHSYEACAADFHLAASLLAPGGTIVLHDTIGFNGVCRVLGEVLQSGRWRLAGHVENLSWVHMSEGMSSPVVALESSLDAR